MKPILWISLVATVALPVTAVYGLGLSISAGVGKTNIGKSDSRFRSAFELSPFIENTVLRFELPLEAQVSPERAFALRPGIKLFVPVVGLYGRLGYGIGNLGSKDQEVTHSLIFGGGWQLSLLDTVGIFFEGTGEPLLKSNAGGTTLMIRGGVMVNL